MAAVVVGAVGIYAMTHQSGGGADSAAGQSVDRRQAVSVAAATVTSFSPSVALNGEVRPRNDLYVFAPSAGVRILELLVDAGDQVAQAQLAEMEARLQGGFVRAPVAGLVIERTAQLGAPAEGQALFRIAGGGTLEAAVQVAESDILTLPRGARAEFTLVDGTTITGELVRLPASVDVRTRTGEAVFALPRDRRVRAGMFVRGQARLDDRQALSVPADAVLFENGAPYVFVIGEDAIARRTPVSIGARSGDLIEIRDGLTAGTRVAASGGAFLQDGDSVTPVDTAAAVAAAG